MSKRNRQKRAVSQSPQNKPQEKRQSIFTKVDVVYPVYGQYNYLDASIKLLDAAAKDITYRIYLTDDKSKDYDMVGMPFYENLKATNPHFAHAIIHKENMGYPRSVNDAAVQGSSKYILVNTTDVFLTEDALKIMVDHIENNEDIAIIAPKLLFFPDSKDPQRPAGKVQHAGLAFNIRGEPYHLFLNWDQDHPMVNTVRDLNAITGACFLIRRSVWQQLKGFSTDYGKGTFEDIDLCIRVKMAGFKIRYLPQAVGFHYTNLSVIAANEGYPLNRNFNILRARLGDNIPYDDWIHCGYLDE